MKSVLAAFSVFLLSLALASCSKSGNSAGTGPTSGSWTQVNGLSAFKEIASDGSTLIAAGVQGVFRSTDGGMNWTDAGASLPAGYYSVAVQGNSVFVANEGPHGIFVSTNDGATWTADDSGLVAQAVPASQGPYQEISALTSNGTHVFAGVWEDGVYSRTSGTAGWSAANAGIKSSSVLTFTSIGSKVFAGTETGIYVSTNNGASWTPADSGLVDSAGVSGTPSVESMVTDGTRIYAGALDGEVFVSKDDGASWTNISENLPSSTGTGTHIAAVDTILVAGDDNGLFTSTNSGATWNNITDNLSDPVVSSVAIVGKYLYVMAANATVWRRPISTYK